MVASLNAATKYKDRLPIIDALRFVLASWVAMGHFGVFPLFAWTNESTKLGRFLIHGWSTTIWGPPAVVGFFVISGFCVHLPYRHRKTLPLGSYYVRRYVRILIPACAFLLLSMPAPILGPGSILWKSVLWSLCCEEIYYAVYPFARSFRQKHGWALLLSAAFVVGLVAAVAFPNALDGTFYGTMEIAVILYPIWLLGALLAEQSDLFPAITSVRAIWGWRFFAWFGSWACEMVQFKGKLPLGFTLLCFGVIAFVWMRKEVAFGKHQNPWRVFASAGLWSYSLYLVHGPADSFFRRLHLPDLGAVVNWCLLYAFIAVLSYIFYRCVEKPAHRLARKLSFSAKPAPHTAPADAQPELAQ